MFFLQKKKEKVFVGVSGGVDSSVSLAILRDLGYDVAGVFIKTWHPEWAPCPWHEERRDAMRVCAHLGVPFLEYDASDEYKRYVADAMISEYRLGRTPNPDVLCNREVKFGAFMKWARAHGAAYIATGHYAQVQKSSDGSCRLMRGSDAGKDQGYFLWTLTEDDLAHTLFPVGGMQKKDVRKLAEKFGLSTATKKDSQGICFLGPVDMKSFLSHYIESVPGNVLDVKGNVIGTHDGALFYTLGERHGFSITDNSPHDTPRYVVAKNIEDNTITVDTNPSFYQEKTTVLKLVGVNIISGNIRDDGSIAAEIRYHGELHKVFDIHYFREEKKMSCVIPGVVPASGQSVVFYRDDECLGGGIVA